MNNGLLDTATWERHLELELRSLREKVNDKALLDLASSLNSGIQCHIDLKDPWGRQMMGGMNVHLRLCFSNGTVWLARILRENFTSFADDLTNSIVTCEYATLKWLEKVDIPTPRVFAYGLKGDARNSIGVTYLLIEELPGEPYLLRDPSSTQAMKVHTAMANVLDKLYSHPLDAIGSLTVGSQGRIGIGPAASDRTGTLRPIGPFKNATQFYAALCDQYLHLISDRQIFTEMPIDAYLMYRSLKQMAHLGQWNASAPGQDDGPFFLKHMDEKGDHVLVDEDYNITGIIDWTFARSVPAYEAFGPTLMTANMADLYDGKVGRSEGDVEFAATLRRQNHALSLYWDHGDRLRRLLLGLGQGMRLSWNDTLHMFKGMLAAIGESMALFDWEQWREQHLEEYRGDPLLCRLGDDVAANSVHS
ncbi:MAG: hypothetical protein M1828_007485 [Chrysothrix sp. TS-e1954]|nr:MAG: hypothetical protein M1828_007485 [Chrysothrix sp. TS-e1954]